MARNADVVRQVAGSAYWREADARVVVAAWRSSGETLSRFAQRYEVDTRRVARWAARLGQGTPAAVHFHPVRLAAESTRERCAGFIEIEVRGGRRVRVGRGFEAEDLRRVLAVLAESASC